MRSTFSFRLRCRVKFSILVMLSLQSDKVNASAAEEDLESTKLRLGGRRTVKRCMRSTTFVGQTSHQFLAMLDADQRELCHHLPKLSKWEGGIEGGNAIHTLCIGNYDDFEANTFSFWYIFPSFSLLPLFFFKNYFFFFRIILFRPINFWVSAFTYLLYCSVYRINLGKRKFLFYALFTPSTFFSPHIFSPQLFGFGGAHLCSILKIDRGSLVMVMHNDIISISTPV